MVSTEAQSSLEEGGMGIICKNANFHSNETDFLERKMLSTGKINLWYKNKKGSTGFGSTLNTQETYRACSHVAIAHLGHVIFLAVTCCYSCGLATGLTAVILTRFYVVSAKQK